MTNKTSSGVAAVGGSIPQSKTSSAGSSKSGKTSSTPNRRSAKVDNVYGRREMKYFNVTDSELSELGTLSLFTTLFIAVGSLMAGFAWDLWLSLDLATNANESAVNILKIGRNLATASAIICYAIAGILFWRQRDKAHKIKCETQFD